MLLAKIWDETTHRSNPDVPLDLQDYSAASDDAVKNQMNECLSSAAEHYNRYLPERVDKTFGTVAPEALRRLSQVLSPVNILASRQKVIQDFYMRFAKDLYRWDLAQFFTPHEVVKFIVDLTNPRLEHVVDPACGSADFLVSALQAMPTAVGTAAEFVTGHDNSPKAVQVAVLNMMLHGDGKTAIKEVDSLQAASDTLHDVVLCNPPFGTRILEKREEVLKNFDMGYRWERTVRGDLKKTKNVRSSQQTGILFAELCVRLCQPGGRVGIILPNGYLGNAEVEYAALREWLFRNTRLVAVIGFPRFTFKKSGADVSASVVVLERRRDSLSSSADSDEYRIYFGMIESVGWRAGDKTAKPIYKRDLETGTLLLDEANEPMLDADFSTVLEEFRRSATAHQSEWILSGCSPGDGPQTPTMSSDDILHRGLILDPKRYSSKYRSLVDSIRAGPHFRLRDVLQPVKRPSFKPISSQFYRYVEIGNVRAGAYDSDVKRGWDLPGRAKLVARPGDVFVAHVWGCAGKWFVSSGMEDDLIVTNGCSQFEINREGDELVIDLVAGLCSELFSVQMRALARGSDGLATVALDDLLEIRLPLVTDDSRRERLQRLVDGLFRGGANLRETVRAALPETWPQPAARKSHCVLV